MTLGKKAPGFVVLVAGRRLPRPFTTYVTRGAAGEVARHLRRLGLPAVVRRHREQRV